MIPVYVLERLSLDDIDKLVEKGVVFDVRSEASLLSENKRDGDRDAFWSGRGDNTDDI